MKRKELLLLFALGRAITPYEVAKRQLSAGSSVDPREAGAFYTCKKELLEDGLIVELEARGKQKPIKTNVLKYFDLILGGIPNEEFREQNMQLFENYSPKIMDFLAKEKWLKEQEVAYPLAFFLFARYLTTVGNYFPDVGQARTVERVSSFVGSLSYMEKEELKIRGNKQEAFRLIFTIIPPELFKEIFLELGVTLFNAAIFRKEQFDYLIDLIDGIESEEDMQFLRDKLEELRLKKLAEIQEYDEKVKQNILKNNE